MPVADGLAQARADACDAGALLLDIGCGDRSTIREMAPHMRLVGVDSEPALLAEAERRGTHDEFVCADVALDLTPLRRAIAGRPVQLICLFHVIEHLPKQAGFDLLNIAESLTDRFVFIDTPNRFLPQGPEWGSEAQRHRSGWFWQDFEGRGYEVCGTAGTRFLRGYAGEPRLAFRGVYSVDAVLSKLLMINRNPGAAYNLTAWKDVRGEPARLGERPR
jgi:hypothetical protein